MRQKSLCPAQEACHAGNHLQPHARKKQVSCEFDELSENNLYNQILKTTMLFLEKSNRVLLERKYYGQILQRQFDKERFVPAISIRCLPNTDFHIIARQLDELAFCFFGRHEIDGEIV